MSRTISSIMRAFTFEGLGIERHVGHVVAVYAAESERESNVLHRNFDVLAP